MPGVNPETLRAAFLLYFDEILDDIVYCTNLEARRYAAALLIRRLLRKKRKQTDREEIESFLGLLIIGGASKGLYWSFHLYTLSLTACLYASPKCSWSNSYF